MERSLFVNVPWVDLQMAVIWVLALAGLLVVTVRLALEGESQGSRRPAAGHASAHGPVQPLTPEWLERLISGIGHPPAPRPRAVERGDLDREVAGPPARPISRPTITSIRSVGYVIRAARDVAG